MKFTQETKIPDEKRNDKNVKKKINKKEEKEKKTFSVGLEFSA